MNPASFKRWLFCDLCVGKLVTSLIMLLLKLSPSYLQKNVKTTKRHFDFYWFYLNSLFIYSQHRRLCKFSGTRRGLVHNVCGCAVFLQDDRHPQNQDWPLNPVFRLSIPLSLNELNITNGINSNARYSILFRSNKKVRKKSCY